ncbi:hypothetical protein QQP08_001295 [Theobroma cacao]|nr:hypothetical protein QQP08_001295 [Theobroma cacao]
MKNKKMGGRVQFLLTPVVLVGRRKQLSLLFQNADKLEVLVLNIAWILLLGLMEFRPFSVKVPGEAQQDIWVW